MPDPSLESITGKIPVILHHGEYRGDHVTDVRFVLMLPPDATLTDLLELVEEYSTHSNAHIEITKVKDPDV